MKVNDAIKEHSGSISNRYIRDAKNDGKKIIGYFCSYIPEEIIEASGCIPYRMRGVGSGSTELADTYYSPTNCLYPRHILNEVMKGSYDFLDGIVFSSSCDHTRRLYDIWLAAFPGKHQFVHFLDVPRVMGDKQINRYRDVLGNFALHLDETFGCSITDEKLNDSIDRYNKRRSMLRTVYRKRNTAGSQFKGSDFLRLMLSVTAMPVTDACDILHDVISEPVTSVEDDQDDSVRLLLSGACMEEVAHLEMIEGMGAVISEDNTCLGWRNFESDVEKTGNPLSDIAKRYLYHLSCPRITNDLQRRLEYVREVIDDNRADAVLLEKMPFCILYSGESYLYREEAKKYGFPLLTFERGYGDNSEGQYKTRIQAFLEEVRNRKNSRNRYRIINRKGRADEGWSDYCC